MWRPPPPPHKKKLGKAPDQKLKKGGGRKKRGQERKKDGINWPVFEILGILTLRRGQNTPPLSHLISDYAPESLSIKTTIGKHLLHCANCFRGLHINCRPIKVGTADLLLCFCRFFYNILRNFRACNLTYIFFNYIKNIFLFVLSRSCEILLHQYV